MRPVGMFLGALASLATILMYLHLDPPWVRDYLPHIAWPSVQTTAEPQQPVFQPQYESGLNSARRHDFTMAVEFYKTAIAAPDATDSERSKALDALGYAYFRMGDYKHADKAFAQAIQITPNAVTPRVNQIKVMCSRSASSNDVQTALRRLRLLIVGDRYDEHETETDKELFRVCSYAGIAPQ